MSSKGYASVVGGGVLPTRDSGLLSLGQWGEADTFTCHHCQKITHIAVRANPEDIGGLCKLCMGLICPHCLGKGCTPWEKEMEKMEARQDALRSYQT
jgi:hypothetical protein